MLRPLALYISRGFYGLALFVTSALVAREWGAEGLGVYSALTTVLNIAVVLSVFGSDIRFVEQSPLLAMRLGSKYDVEEHRGAALALVILQSLLILPFASLAIRVASPKMEIVAIAVTVMALTQLVGNMLISAGRQLHYALIMQIVRPLILLAVLYLAAFRGSELRTAMLWALIISFGAAILLSLLVVKVRRPSKDRILASFTADWWRASLILVFLALYSILSVQADRLIVLHLRGAEEAGLYAASQNVLNLINYAVNAIMTLAMPIIASGLARGADGIELGRQLRRMSRPLWLFSASIIPVFWLVGDKIFSFFGPEFNDATVPLVILAFGLSGGLLFGFPITVLTLSDEKGALVWASLIALVLTLLLSFILISGFGLVGAACSYALSNTCSRAGFHLLCVKRTGVDSSVFGLQR